MHNYFKTYKGYFWHWDADHDHMDEEAHYVATITDGQSIAYYPKIIEILEDLQPQGLPPFGAILLILIATNEHIDDVTMNHLERILLSIESSKTTENAITVLDSIRNLPYRLKTGQNLTLLVQTLFRNCHNRMGVSKSKILLDNVQNDYYNYYIKIGIPEETDLKIFHKDIRAIALLIRRFKSAEDISNAMQNIPDHELGDTIVLEEQISNEQDLDKSFIDQLTENKNTYQIGSLIKRIWSGLHIPMHHNVPSSQPLGGVSDITNKGDFSRLLISEFAFEDDTFMSRIANNEALYIERETPPETNDKSRVFLIDATLKNWGIPKVLSFATSIAIAQHPKSDFDYRAYVVGQDYAEAPIKTIYDVIDSQQILSGGLQPSEGLRRFFEAYKDPSQQEIFFFTEAKNLEHPDLQNVLYTFHDHFNYIITTQTNGAIDFYKHQNRSRKHFQHILLPYQELWDNQKPRSNSPLVTKNSDIEVDHLLLEPIDISNVRIIPFEDTYYLIQNDNLYTLTSAGLKKGIQLVCEQINFNRHSQYTLIRDHARALILVSFNTSEKQLSKLHLKTKAFSSKTIESKEAINDTTVLFAESNNIMLSNKTHFWNVTDQSKLFLVTGNSAFSESMTSYFDKVHEFRQALRIHRVNYNILKNINRFRVKHSYADALNLVIDDFLLEHEYIKSVNQSRYQFHLKSGKSYKLDCLQVLILKRTGSQPLSVIKYLKENFNIDLKKAKTLIDDTPSVIAKQLPIETAEQFKLAIENLGATCYTYNDFYQSKDGSTIHIKNGQLIFTSSKAFIPKFYITSVINHKIGMATEGEFAGNPYYLPVNHQLTAIDVQEFYKKYINPFLNQIIEHDD